jgi:hypothetical protein
MEEVKILQTLMVLVSCLDFVHGELLAKVPASDILSCSAKNPGFLFFLISGVCTLLSIAFRTRLCY